LILYFVVNLLANSDPQLIKNQKQKEDAVKQRKIDNMFMKIDKPVEQPRIVSMDIEDMGSIATPHSTSASGYSGEGELRVNKGKKRSRKSFEGDKYGLDVVSSEEEQEEPPKEEDDYQAWLSYQKNKWKKLRRDRKRRKELYGDVSNKCTSPPLRYYYQTPLTIVLFFIRTLSN